jgi:hypothetical protein
MNAFPFLITLSSFLLFADTCKETKRTFAAPAFY